jgi:flagellar hook-associated protein 3 FlgL
MTIRITQNQLFSRALSDIHRTLGRFNSLQGQVATGRRISRPSDDPAAALRIIPLQNDLRNLEQMGSNVALARETLNTGASALEDASSLMQRLRELTMQAANGSISAGDRESIGQEMDQLLQQLVGIGNSRRGDRYLFGGTESSGSPFELVRDGDRSRVIYQGNHDRLEIDVAPGVQTALNLPGDSIFQLRNRSGVTFGGDTGAAPYANGNTGVGYQDLEVAFMGLHGDAPTEITSGAGRTNALGKLSYTFTPGPGGTLSIDGGPALPVPTAGDSEFTTADGRIISLNVSGIPAALTGQFTAKAGLSTDGGDTYTEVTDFSLDHVAVRSSFDDSVLQVDVQNLTRTGSEVVKHEGTFDAFTVMITLRDLLQNADGLDSETVQERTSAMLAEIDNAHDAVLDGLRELGFRSASMDMLSNRVANLEMSRQESLSALQDTDFAQAVLDLQQQDLAYQAALQIGSRVLQTTLQNYL